MHIISLLIIYFVATCLAADNSSRVISDDNSDSNDKPPLKTLHPFLQFIDTWKDHHDPLLVLGFALERQTELACYDSFMAEVFVSKDKLIEIVNTEYDVSTGKANPFSEMFNVRVLLKELRSSDLSLEQFRKIVLRCARNKNVLISVDIAILHWLLAAIDQNINVKVKSHWFRSLRTLLLYPEYCKYLQNIIINVLAHVDRLVESNTLSRVKLIKYGLVFKSLTNVPETGPILDKLWEIYKKLMTMSN